jgi:hypothetical protein
MEVIETEQYKGYTIEIYPDHCDESPREWDNLCELHCWHRRMSLGDFNYNPDNDSSREELNAKLREAKKNRDIVLPLYIYQHSGVALSLTNTVYPFNDQWDAGQVGFVIIRRKEALTNMIPERKILAQKRRKRCIAIAEAEIGTYNQYFCGDVYGYCITKNDTDEDKDSYWDFYGREEVMREAKSVVDYYVEQDRKEHQKRLKEQIKHKAPLEARVPL